MENSDIIFNIYEIYLKRWINKQNQNKLTIILVNEYTKVKTKFINKCH